MRLPLPSPVRDRAGEAVTLLRRGRQALGYFTPKLAQIGKWLVESRETTNFTYDVTHQSLDYLGALLALILEREARIVREAFGELQADEELAAHIVEQTRRMMEAEQVRDADLAARYGRRIGWYALVRLTKPRIVIETGVDKGLGACVIAAALRRNAAEGAPGRYFGTDLNPRAGWLLAGPYAEVGEILVGDSIESLRRFEGTVDLFINDSDHSAAYERGEYEAIAEKLAARALVLSDNAHVSRELLDFAERTGRRFAFWPEWPAGHWYPGAGIGIAF